MIRIEKAARLTGPSLLLLLWCTPVSLAFATEQQKTAFERLLAAGDEAEQVGRYVEAEKQLSAAVAEAKKSGSQDHRLGLALSHLAGLYFHTGDTGRAVATMKQALAEDERALGPTHARVVNDLSNLAVFSASDGQRAEAEKLYKRALEIQGQNPDASDYQTTNLLSNLSHLYMRQHRYAECEPLLERAIAIIENSSHRWGPTRLASLRRSLAEVYRQEGRESEAQTLENNAYEGVRPLGNSPANSAALALDRAENSRRNGNLIAAETGFREVMAATENQRDLTYRSILTGALDGLARVCAAEERDAEAEEFLLRALALHEESASPDSPWEARNLSYPSELINVYRKQGRLADMEPVFERALQIQEKVLGTEDPAVGQTLIEFGRIYRGEGRNKEAIPLYQRALRIQEKNEGRTTRFASTLNDYSSLLQDLGEDVEAARARAEADAILDRPAAQQKKHSSE